MNSGARMFAAPVETEVSASNQTRPASVNVTSVFPSATSRTSFYVSKHGREQNGPKENKDMDFTSVFGVKSKMVVGADTNLTEKEDVVCSL